MQDGKRLGEFLSRHLAGLSVAQKLAAGTLVAVMIITALWLGGRGSRGGSAAGRMEPILDQSFADAELNSITQHLRSRSIACEVRDGKVYVPADKKLDVLSDLYYTAVLTGGAGGGENGFDELTAKMSAFDPPSKTDKLFNRAREQTCERVIGRFHGVRKATVVIDPTNERHIGAGSIVPVAMVDIQTQGESSPRQLSAASINVVTGSVAQLSRERVMVTVDGATYNSAAGGQDLAATDEMLARKQQCEQVAVAKVRKLLSYIPDVVVSVSVDLNVQPQANANANANANASSAGAEGVIVNAVPVLAADGAAGTVSAKPGTAATGKEIVRSASVVVPRSYFVGIYRRANRKQSQSQQDPDDALLQPVVDAHLARIRGLVKNALGLERESDVTVEPYDDAAVPAGAPAAPAVVTAGTAPAMPAIPSPPAIAALIARHAREIAIAAMAVMTLILLTLLTLIRRRAASAAVALPSTVLATASPSDRGDPVLSGTLESPAVSAGPAIDEGEAHRMFRRVRDVVAENPDDAARVLRGWIYQGQ